MRANTGKYIFSLLLAAGLSLPASLTAAPAFHGELRKRPSSSIKEEIIQIQKKLDQLPLRLIRESGGTLGFRSQPKKTTPDQRWVEVDLGSQKTFDTVILVPAIWINEQQQRTDYGFPRRYHVVTYSAIDDQQGSIIFDSASDLRAAEPNLAPIIISCPDTKARRIRIVALEQTTDPDNGRFTFALSELLVFRRKENLALGHPVTASNANRFAPIWNAQYLTDGYMPFSQPATREKYKNNFCQIRTDSMDTSISIVLDLGREYPLDEVRLYPVHIGNNYAAFHRTAQGFPLQFKIDIASASTFSNAVTVFDTGLNDYPSPGHHLAMFHANNATGRYVRVKTARNSADPHSPSNYMLAFSEIEIVSEGEVVSRNADVRLSHKAYSRVYTADQLVDGRSSHGKIPPLRTWLFELGERRDLENTLVHLQTDLQRHYLRQSVLIRRLGWGIALVILFSLISILWQRLIRQRHIYRLREHLAADLHDEIGGTLSGIALLCDQLISKPDTPPAHRPLLETIADASRTSAANTRDLVRFLESHGINGELIKKMQSSAARMLTNQTYRFDIEGGQHISKLAPKDKWHLLLFFKESLTNINKHANATEVSIFLNITAHSLNLTISDNGIGMIAAQYPPAPPSHLALRAKKLNGRLTVSSPARGGTTITLEKKI